MVTAAKSAWVPHAVLMLGLALVVFPVYVALVASSLSLQDILDAPMTLVPGPDFAANYREALAQGTAGTNGQPVAAMMLNSLVMALAIAIGKIAISLPSAYAVDFLPLSAAPIVLLGDLCHLDAAGRGADHSDLQDRRRSRPDRHLSRPGSPADRFGDGNIAVPSILSDDPGRAGRGRQDRRCRTLALSGPHGHSAVADQYRSTCS